MVEGDGGASFPVLFFDGEREIDIGDVRIHPKLVYKTFQCMLAQEIGISPNQISIYLIDRTNTGNRRKIPITGKANFAQICRERNCFFLVILKRSRKTRNRHGEFNDDFVMSLPPIMPEKVVLLRRDQPPPVAGNYNFPFYDQLGNMQQYQHQYAFPKIKQGFPKIEEAFPKIEEAYPKMIMNKPTAKYFCEECTSARKQGEVAEFHHCVNDVVVEGFRRSPAGPIGPIRW